MDNQNQKQLTKEQAAEKREYAKVCILTAKGNKAKVREGLTALQEACMQGDPEAIFIMAKLNLEGFLTPTKESREERGMKLLFQASEMGSLQARVMLNELCQEKYQQDFKLVKDRTTEPHPLVDFEGKPIVIQRTGLFTPIDAVLEFKEGKNILTFKCNLDFMNLYAANDGEKFKEAVVKGVKAWEGEYQVFGGQQLTIKIEVTTENKLLDSIHIYLMNDEGRELFGQTGKLLGKIGQEETQSYIENLAAMENSFATIGRKWSVKSKKMICIVKDDTDEVAYDDITGITTHEFGHALGLGDLYKNPQAGMPGVPKGTFVELDSYYVAPSCYHLAMGSHQGLISNNDIEMIVLAFSENARQNYQPDRWGTNISEALGKGN